MATINLNSLNNATNFSATDNDAVSIAISIAND
jgi:hypothetical protein